MDRQEMKQKKMMGAILPGNSTVELREFDMPKTWTGCGQGNGYNYLRQ